MTDDVSNARPIEGKVASVLNERELAINIGSENGVRLGMKFNVLADKPTKVIDPESNELLGEIDRVKVRVQAVEVQARFSVCRTYKNRYIDGGPLYQLTTLNTSMNALGRPPRQVVETLKAEDASLPPPLSERESYVKKGDRVTQLMREDD